MDPELEDWVRAPNIAEHPDLYERENEALAADGSLDVALREVADWAGRTLLDIGSGTGFWLPRYARTAGHVIGVEPDPALRLLAEERVRELDRVEVLRGSAERLPVDDASVDVVHARFAYFFGAGAEAGLAEARRVLRPGGVFVAVDNSWRWGQFAELLEDATTGNAAVDPDGVDRWWLTQGARRVEVHGAWRCASADELEQVLRIEFPDDVVDRHLSRHPGQATITYGFALFVIEADHGG